MDHSYDTSSRRSSPERPIRTYRRSNKPPLVKEIKVENNIKLEPDVEIVDDCTTSEIPSNDQVDSDQISIHETYPPEMLVINIQDVMTSTHFDPELLSAVKPPSITEMVMKPERLGKESEVSNSEQVEKRRVSVKPVALPVPPLQPKRPDVVLRKPTESETLLSKSECSETPLKLNSPEKVLPKSDSTGVSLLKPKSPEKVLLEPNSPRVVLLKSQSREPNSPETVLLKPQSLRKPQSLLKPQILELNSPEAILLKPQSLEQNSCEAVLLKPQSLQPNSPEGVLPKPESLLKPISPEEVLVNTKCSIPVPLKVKSTAATQVKPKLPCRLLPKPEVSESALLKLTSSESVQSHLNTLIANPSIPSVSEVVESQKTSSEALRPIMSGAVPLKACISKGVLNAHETINHTRPGSTSGRKLTEAFEVEECYTSVEAEPERRFKNSTFAAAPVKPFVSKTARLFGSEHETAYPQTPEATLVKLKRKGGAVLVMTRGNKLLRRTPSVLDPEPSSQEFKTERPDEILEPKVIKLNLPEYVVNYEPNTKAPALPPVSLLPLIPLPLPSIIDDEPPMIVDSVKHLQEQLAPLLPRNWSLRVDKDGIFAMLFAPGLTCAVQRAIYASYDGSDLRFIVHGRVVPKDHSVYEYRLMKPPVALTVENVRDFVSVVMGAIHSMIQHHVCIGINDEESIREKRNHPGCRLDDNFYGEEGYAKTLRSLQCAYLVWRKNTKRCSECLSFKTLWRTRTKRRSTHSKEVWEVREPKSRRR